MARYAVDLERGAAVEGAQKSLVSACGGLMISALLAFV
jgi:hypothetical protein